jgi:hypothetical protein
MCILYGLFKNEGKYTACIDKVYNLTDIRIRCRFFYFKRMKLLDIVIPHNMNNLAYKFALNDIKKYIQYKTCVVKENKGYVNLYHDNYYVNNCINNIILFNYMTYSN